jgi:hypothetical protein
VINIGGHVRKSQLSSGRCDIGEAQAQMVEQGLAEELPEEEKGVASCGMSK